MAKLVSAAGTSIQVRDDNVDSLLSRGHTKPTKAAKAAAPATDEKGTDGGSSPTPRRSRAPRKAAGKRAGK